MTNHSTRELQKTVLNAADRKQYRTLGHGLKPVVTIANHGLSEGVLKELERALDDHELIKIRVISGDRHARKSLIDALIGATGCTLVQQVGQIALLLRRNPKANPALSNLLRPAARNR